MSIDLKQQVTRFIQMVEQRRSADELAEFYHPDIEQTEFPNAVTKNTAVRNLADLRAASERGKKVLVKEEYEILKIYTEENTAILEAVWKGTIAIPLGNIPAGGQLKAYFAQFFEFKDGKIYRQRNYDCFEPFN